MKIARELYDEIVAHALEKPHTEVCGLVAVKGDEAKRVYRCMNADAEKGWGGASFELDPLQQLLLLETIERDGHELGAIYHSHPGMDAVPSGIDEDYAAGWPGVVWIIVSINGWRAKNRAKPNVWAWRMKDDQIYTAELEIA
jgi:proteasome lid subunit RPN8/RPN11